MAGIPRWHWMVAGKQWHQIKQSHGKQSHGIVAGIHGQWLRPSCILNHIKWLDKQPCGSGEAGIILWQWIVGGIQITLNQIAADFKEWQRIEGGIQITVNQIAADLKEWQWIQESLDHVHSNHTEPNHAADFQEWQQIQSLNLGKQSHQVESNASLNWANNRITSNRGWHATMTDVLKFKNNHMESWLAFSMVNNDDSQHAFIIISSGWQQTIIWKWGWHHSVTANRRWHPNHPEPNRGWLSRKTTMNTVIPWVGQTITSSGIVAGIQYVESAAGCSLHSCWWGWYSSSNRLLHIVRAHLLEDFFWQEEGR